MAGATVTTPLPGFDTEQTTIKPRLFLSVEAVEKQGKTHFALTAPGPIAYINLDRGLEGVIQKFQTQKVIGVASFVQEIQALGRNPGKDEADAIWRKVVEKWRLGLRHARTVVLDTGTKAWELIRLARLGKLTQVMPHHYGPVNAEFDSLMNEAYDYDANAIILHRRKAEYINDKRTGEYERAGYKDIGFVVQGNLLAYRVSSQDREAGDLGFRVRVINCRQNPEIDGLEFENTQATFGTVASWVYPEVDPAIWE